MGVEGLNNHIISIHALLAESDSDVPVMSITEYGYFYPRSPCGERRPVSRLRKLFLQISIHALLAESDLVFVGFFMAQNLISIHALLAESDAFRVFKSNCFSISIHALSKSYHLPSQFISIHALLAESDTMDSYLESIQSSFLSTLSLRRATLEHCAR